jgi:hypothetical protein
MGCDSDSTGPVELSGMYELVSADSRAVPVRSFTSISNSAGSCVYDLVLGTLTFSDAGQYGLSFSYDVRCTGSPGVTRTHDITSGTYSRSGNTLSLAPKVHSTFVVESVRLQSGSAIVSTRTNAGSQHTFRFNEVRY